MSKKLSSGFAGTTTRKQGGFVREVESRMKKLDVFTEDFSPPGASDVKSGQDVSKGIDDTYGKAHDDFAPSNQYQPAKVSSAMAAAGNAGEQEMLDEMDEQYQKDNADIKKYKDQFPGARQVLEKLSAGVDEGLWSKAKKAYKDAINSGEKIDDKWAFIMSLYEKWGGK